MIHVQCLIGSLGGGGAEKGFINLVNELDPQQFDVTIHCYLPVWDRLQELSRLASVACSTAGPNLFFGKKSRRLLAAPGRTLCLQVLSPGLYRQIFPFGFYDAELLFMDGVLWKVIVGAPGNTRKLLRFANDLHRISGQVDYIFPALKALHQTTYALADQTIFPARASLESYREVVGPSNHLHVIYNVNRREELEVLAAAPCCVPKTGLTLCASGRLDPQKGYPRLFQICRRLLDEGFRFQLWILGQGPLKQELVQLSAQLQLQDTVVFLGYQQNPYPFVAAADLFVSSAYYEGLSNSAKEALLLGVPCVVADCSGMKEIFGDHSEYGLVTDPDDESLYQGIRRMVASPKLRDQYRQSTAQRWDFFSPARSVAQYNAIFEGREPDASDC